MKVKKILLGVVLCSLFTIFLSCKQPAEPPKVTSIIGYDYDWNQINFNNGDTHTDPAALRYIEIKFDHEMNTNYGSYIWYYLTGEYVLSSYWANSRTYCFMVQLPYDENFCVILNDESYNNPDDDYSTKVNWLRDTNGNYLPQYKIEFSTKSNTNVKNEYEFDMNKEISKDILFDLEYNEYGPNLQTGISIRELILPNKLKEGDVLKVKYKIRSGYNLPEIIVNLVDDSKYAKNQYWTLLADETDVKLTNEPISASTVENPIYYENEITFNIVEDMSTRCALVFTCNTMDSKDPVQFILPATK